MFFSKLVHLRMSQGLKESTVIGAWTDFKFHSNERKGTVSLSDVQGLISD